MFNKVLFRPWSQKICAGKAIMSTHTIYGQCHNVVLPLNAFIKLEGQLYRNVEWDLCQVTPQVF